MHLSFNLIPLVLLVANEAAATKILFQQTVTVFLPVRTGVLITDDNHYHNIGFRDSGCTNAGLSFVKEMCIDGSKQRAHIYWTNQPNKKYCFAQQPSEHTNCGQWQTCSRWEFTETPCTW
ncbi:hypothetical protein C7974DRAFT_27231 [Boeremia exigua]|uniref:uncharacterized protein n=1 Tax=Boeremia exigua TaxID=749465 RepID=UPI001E8E547B|nr:uncharacterized protein C7974DRAFT_27231 [Boeremia exigua]KAH6644756.1 hypothetical protein C7974DRAFT_27231 [Boeremia exigua]